MPAPVITSPPYRADWLKHETDPQMGRANITIKAASGALAHGTVIAQITATKKWVPLSLAAVPDGETDDGSRVAAGILWDYCSATVVNVDVTAVAVVADAIIAPNALVWPTGITTNQKNAALAALATRNIQTVRVY